MACLVIGTYNLIRKKSAFSPKLKPARIFIILYAVLTFIAFLLSEYKASSLVGMSRYEGLITILLYCACAFFVSIYAVPKMIHLYAFGLGVSICSLVAIAQLLGNNPFGLFPNGLSYYDKGVLYSGAYLGTVGNVDLLSGILDISLPLFIGFAIIKRKEGGAFLIIPAILSFIVFIAMKVSGCYVGILAGLIICIPCFSPDKYRKKVVLIEAIIAAIVIIAVLCIYLFGLNIGGISIPKGFKIPDSGRLYIWKNVWELIKESPLFGYGPDTLQAKMTAHFERFDPITNQVLTASIDVAHNEYLNVWVNQGIFAMLAFIGIIASAILPGLFSSRNIINTPKEINCGTENNKTRPDKTIKIIKILTIALLCYAVQAFFEISMIINAPFFWILIGILIKTNSNE